MEDQAVPASNTQDQPAEVCPICLTEYTDSEPAVASKCGHFSHGSCLRSAIRAGSYTCSICRSSLGNIVATSKSMERYVKMLRANIPTAAVRQRMEADSISKYEIDAFLSGGVSAIDGIRDDVLDTKPSLDKSTLKPYAQMLKCGIMEGAVRQKMALNAKCPEAEIDQFFTEYMNGEYVDDDS